MPENKRERARTFFVVFFVHELMCTQCIKGKNSYRFKKKNLIFFLFVHKFYLSSHRIYNMQVWHVCTNGEQRKKKEKHTHTHTHIKACVCARSKRCTLNIIEPIVIQNLKRRCHRCWNVVAHIWFTIAMALFFLCSTFWLYDKFIRVILLVLEIYRLTFFRSRLFVKLSST